MMTAKCVFPCLLAVAMATQCLGYMMDLTYGVKKAQTVEGTPYRSELVRSKVQCVAFCARDRSCDSVAYNVASRDCQFFTVPLGKDASVQLEPREGMKAFLPIYDDWHVVFRVSSGYNPGQTLVNLWLTGASMGEDKPALQTTDNTFAGAYKSSLVLTHFDKFIQIRVSFYKAGTETAFVLLDARGSSSRSSWFSKDRILASSFTDLSKTSITNYFSIEGHKSTTHSRRFFAWRNYGGCPNDLGWFVVLDTDHGVGTCPFEKGISQLPRFTHASGNTASNLDSGYTEADIFMISALLRP